MHRPDQRPTRSRVTAARQVVLALLLAGAALLAVVPDRAPAGMLNLPDIRVPTVRTPNTVVPKANRVTGANRLPGAGVDRRVPGPRRPRGPGIVVDTGAGPFVGLGGPNGLAVDSSKDSKTGTKKRTVAKGNNPIPPRVGATDYAADQVLLEVPLSLPQRTVDAVLRRHRLTLIDVQELQLIGSKFLLVRITDRRSVPQTLLALARERNVASRQPNYYFSLEQMSPPPSDAIRVPSASLTPPPAPEMPPATPTGDPAQYVLGKLHLADAHRLSTGDKVLVAIIDSGIDETHPDLAGVIADKFDALGTDEKPHPHGTAMAGAIVAHGRLLGIAPAARILAVRAFGIGGQTAKGTSFNIIKGLEWAATAGARIVNMSFAGPFDPVLARELAAAGRKGIIIIAAAGNAGPKSPPLFPASDPNVIAVTATGPDDQIFSSANRGRFVAISAPGVDILAAAPNGTYQMTSGTSIATAHVSGVVALLLERRGTLDPGEVRRILAQTARDLGLPGPDEVFGAGLIDAARALGAVAPRSAESGGKP